MRKISMFLLFMIGVGSFLQAQTGANDLNIEGHHSTQSPPGNVLSSSHAISVSGTVTEAAGAGMPGVNVIEKGTTNGTVTDSEGKFSLTVADQSSTLVFSFIGYVTQEIVVDGKTVIDVRLEADVATLNEVVVVGYAEQKRESLTGAISTISTKEIQTTTHTSLAQKLQGKLAAVNIRQNSGQPGDFNSSINIRGFGEPIYVIDGIRREGGNEFQRLNPNDIESITVLKDASAAIYGLGASNGVILITTKKGSGRPTFNYSVVAGAMTPTDMPKMANAAQYVQMYNDAQLFRPGGQPYLPKEEIQKYIDGAPGYESTDWYDLTMKKYATQIQHNLSASGGNDFMRYFIGLGYVNEQGLLKSEDMGYKRYNIRANVTMNLAKNLEGQFLVAGRFDERWEPGENFFNIFKGTRVTLPIEKPYANNTPGFYAPVLSTQNPLALSERDLTGYGEGMTRNLQSSFSLQYKVPFVKGLSLKGVASYDANNYQGKSLFKPYNLYTYDENESNPYVPVPQRLGTGNLGNYNSNNNAVTLQGYINYDNNFFGKHHVNAVFVVEQNQWNDRWSNLTRYYAGFYTKDQIRFADRQRMENDGLENQSASLSYIGRLNYDFKGKYLLELAGRYMGSYAYGPSNRWGFHPVASVGWRVTGEKFMERFAFISNLKLRSSYGMVGSGGGIPFQFVPGYVIGSGGSYEFADGTLTTGVGAPPIVNENLSWITSKQFDLGYDVGLFDDKIVFEFDWYNRKLEGIPTRRNVSLPNTFGSELPEENINSQLTRGIEFTLTYKNRFDELTYSVSGNFNYARTKNLHVERGGFLNSWDRYRNGQADRWNDIEWGYTYTGQFQNEEELLYAPMQNGDQGNIRKELPGDFRYKDLNNDGVIDGQDEAPIFYDGTPKIHFGLNVNAAWKGFDLNILLQGAAKYTLYFSEVYAELFAFRGNTPAYFYDRWHKADPYDPDSEWVKGEWPASRTVETVGRMYAESSKWRKDASYLRIKSVELGYTLRHSFISKVGIQSLRLYVSGFNLHTFADSFVKPFDPEKLEGSGGNRAGFTYPVIKSYNVGLNLSF
ncbi:SusC/RagA family TonB-linked outer membrane protein [Pseudochryseolinea flava]|uniref:SusC/RagA family TonB-linked outer membrane protein n=1 Tax=Pseudochryseolinea flava TaxID=2059302 RepID=A0A364XVR4_9BACT|nr:TonB-dependent receptor [Pseudochryseolinea flava]RAV98206.1 SusC/RagA family TonB-linked outer membrane protein [Pseudochryseolinea flava]